MKPDIKADSSKDLIKEYLLKVYYLKNFYIIFLGFCLGLAFIINNYSLKEYKTSAVVGPTQETSSATLASNNMFSSLRYYNTGRNVDDAINDLNSFSLILSTINTMNFEIGYYSEKKSIFKQIKDLYLNSPLHVNIDKSHNQTINTKFYVSIINDSTFNLKASNKKAYVYNYIDNKVIKQEIPIEIDTVCRFNETITNKDFKFSVTLNKELTHKNKKDKSLLFFRLYNPELLAKAYLSNLKVESVSVMASIIKIEFNGTNIEKSINFLNTYVNSFLEQNLAKKNKMSVNTINFIDSQISGISDSLARSESRLRNYKESNQVMDLSFQGQQIYDQLNKIEQDRTNLELQSRYYNYVLKLFKTNQDLTGVVPPSSANITDPIMNKLFTDLIALNAERANIISKNNNEKNIFLLQIDNKIKSQRATIIENVTSNLNTISLNLNELNYKANKLSKQISTLPKTEMNMVNIQRKFNLNDANYTYLLQKKSEAAIALASNHPDYEVLEPARAVTSEIVKPKILLNYLLAIFIGLLIPTGYLVIKESLNDKLTNKFEIQHVIDRAIFGVIYKNHKNYEEVVEKSPKSAISESFRILRSSLFRKLKSENSKTVLITSAQPGDGKSFVSFNLAASIASVGYKTVLVDCDLRRPVLHKKFNSYKGLGLSNVMYIKKDERTEYKEIISKTPYNNLSFIPAGPILPNPSELIDLGVLDDLIDFLKANFDYIVIDTSPVAIVSDSVQLMKYASLILLVTRLNSTRKDIFSNAISSLDANAINNFEVILNEMDIEKSPYSAYRSYYLKEQS